MVHDIFCCWQDIALGCGAGAGDEGGGKKNLGQVH